MSSATTVETSQQLWYERSISAAVYIGAMAWGLHAAVTYATARTIFATHRSHVWLVSVFTVFALATINICCSINFNQRAWIDNRNYPGGPLAFFTQQQSIPVSIVATATSVVTLFFADAFLINRCHALWRKLYLTVFFCAILMASTIMSVLHCIQLSRISTDLWDEATIALSVPYVSLAMSLNILLSLALLWRLLDLRRRLPPTVPAHTKAAYASWEAIFTESALPSGLASLIFIALYGAHSPGANLFVALFVQLEGIVPQLIIVRMVHGRAWAADTVPTLAPVQLGPIRSAPRRMSDVDSDAISLATLNDDAGHVLDLKPPAEFV